MLVNKKQIARKGGQKDIPSLRDNAPPPAINRKEQIMLSEKLVTNAVTTGGSWEFPPLNLLSDAPGQKADRGDIKRVASVIEKTLQSFGIEARVSEVNLGPAVTQYALEIAL